MTRVTAAIMNHDGRLLIAKRKATARLPHLWELPGGKIEPGETPQECLRRELMEEFAIGVTVNEFVGAHIHTYDFGTVELLVFRVTWETGNLVLNDHAEIRWVFAQELDQFDFAPADTTFIEKLMQGSIPISG
jgi:8-oxo-dGTP diphosphatase